MPMIEAMLDPETALLVAGWSDPNRERDAQQVAALNASHRRPSALEAAVGRVQALLGRTQAPADCSSRDC